MKRLVETSDGRIELDVTKVRMAGLSVTVTVLGEDGWERGRHVWGERWSEDETLAAAIGRTANLPPDEAERIASETLEQWKTRGGEEEASGDRPVLAYVGTTFVFAALGLIAVIAFAVWLVT